VEEMVVPAHLLDSRLGYRMFHNYGHSTVDGIQAKKNFLHLVGTEGVIVKIKVYQLVTWSKVFLEISRLKPVEGYLGSQT
jgi:hypothetical protein